MELGVALGKALSREQLAEASASPKATPNGVRDDSNLCCYRALSSAGEVLVDEARTLAALAWIIGGMVGVLFVLEAIAPSMS